MFSAVFEGARPDTVLKLTADSVGYWMLNCSAAHVNSTCFPTLINNHGCVTDIRIGKEEFPVYLYEIERLQPVKRGTSPYKLMRTVMDCADRHAYNLYRKATTGSVLAAMSASHDMTKALRSAADELHKFASYYEHAELDLHNANFMCRPNGDLVMSDPLADGQILKAHHAHMMSGCQW